MGKLKNTAYKIKAGRDEKLGGINLENGAIIHNGGRFCYIDRWGLHPLKDMQMLLLSGSALTPLSLDDEDTLLTYFDSTDMDLGDVFTETLLGQEVAFDEDGIAYLTLRLHMQIDTLVPILIDILLEGTSVSVMPVEFQNVDESEYFTWVVAIPGTSADVITLVARCKYEGDTADLTIDSAEALFSYSP
ncbi:hypothetical protein AMJ86_00755 [bacterium SM23_57]|nr:MAG: hypothetical protein AMJ86_00755 [bacterium SM23_57]